MHLLDNYTLETFLQDPSFRHWVFKTDAAEQAKWDKLLTTQPEKQIIARQAALLLTGIPFAPVPISEAQVEESRQRLKHRLAFQNNATRTLSAVKKQTYSWQRWAAVWVLVCISSGLFYYVNNKQSELVYHTNFGETTTLILPDSSTVVLNGNTTLRYAANWHSQKSREVWLEGEAFFSVLKKPGKGNAHFIVHTPDVNVKVLGTRFNVTNRRQKTRIVLNSGKVSLSSNKPAAQHITETLTPGEMAELVPAQQKFRKRQVNPELYSSWTHKKLIFEATPLAEIVTLLEENYGFKVKVASPDILTRKITGEIYIDDVNTLLVALSTSFNLKLEKQDSNTLLITPHEGAL